MDEYTVGIADHEGLTLYKKINGVLTAIGYASINYAIDEIIADSIKRIVILNSPFMKDGKRAFYKVSDDFGKALELHIKVYNMLPDLREKLLYIDRTQIFTLLEEQQFKKLIDRLNIYYLAKKLVG